VLDGQGSVVALVDATGSVVDRYRYDLWGQPVVYQGGVALTSEGAPQPLRYRSYWYDGWYDGAGLWTAGHGAYATPYNRPLPWYWLTTRPYDPALERFLQPDPSSQDGVRSYAYAHDDTQWLRQLGKARRCRLDGATDSIVPTPPRRARGQAWR